MCHSVPKTESLDLAHVQNNKVQTYLYNHVSVLHMFSGTAIFFTIRLCRYSSSCFSWVSLRIWLWYGDSLHGFRLGDATLRESCDSYSCKNEISAMISAREMGQWHSLSRNILTRKSSGLSSFLRSIWSHYLGVIFRKEILPDFSSVIWSIMISRMRPMYMSFEWEVHWIMIWCRSYERRSDPERSYSPIFFP